MDKRSSLDPISLSEFAMPETHASKHKVYPASKLGEYHIIRDIAEGTFGKVRMAQHTVTGHKVAMKFISKQVIHQTRTKTRVQREVDYMKALRHPHIIKLYEVISTPTDIIIVLEYAGGELFNYIVSHGKMPEPQARKFFQQLISGIEYSHRLKIVHRDLKPENVLLDDDLNVKIADFGLSNQIQDGDFLKTSCGSPNYAAPEVIRGGLYTGPEIDVWSAGVILYVMICGRLPFEDDDVQTLFRKISDGVFHVPSYMSSDARQLITGMLAVDPVKRMTIEEVVQHPYYIKDLPRYLTPLPTTRTAVLGTLQNLALPPKPLDFEIIDGLGRIEEDVIDELAERMEGVDRDDIWDSLRRDDGLTGNAVKVAYMLLRDKRRLGQDLAVYEEQERDAQLALMDPRNAVSPNALSPTGTNDLKANPFETQFRDGFGEDDEEAEDEDEDEDGLDFSTPPALLEEMSNFAVLNSSLPDAHGPEQHHLTSYASAKRMGGTPTGGAKDKKQSRTKWHFGIRSRSPPMEVMHEIYRVLKALGMEWREKRDLGGLGGVPKDQRQPPSPSKQGRRSRTIEQAQELDVVDNKKAASIYFVETRGRVGDVVVLMNVQLYMVDSINYLVDFHHKKSYKASTEPGAGPFDMEIPDHISETGSDGGHIEIKEEDIVSPFVFMDLACRLILELAGGPE